VDRLFFEDTIVNDDETEADWNEDWFQKLVRDMKGKDVVWVNLPTCMTPRSPLF
jgi:hypothetical protein